MPESTLAIPNHRYKGNRRNLLEPPVEEEKHLDSARRDVAASVASLASPVSRTRTPA
jgi:hypothetical protein